MPRVILAIGVFAIWTAITVAGGPAPEVGLSSLLDAVAGQVGWSFLAAAAFALGAIGLFRWRDAGLGRPRPLRSLATLWLPLLYILAFLALAIYLGPPPGPVVAMIFLNCALVGLSEELMFRGILLPAFLARFRLWPAVIAATLVFGAVHSLNALIIGAVLPALVQSVTAFITGLMLAAIRIRTHSLWPGIALHTLWNFGSFLMLAADGGASAGDLPAGGMALQGYLVPLLFVLPNGIYAVWLLRPSRRAT